MTNLTPQKLGSAADGLTGSALEDAMLAKLKPETGKAVLACHMMHREMKGLETMVPVLSWVTIWIRDWGLDEADAATILRAQTDPEMAAKHKFPSDLKTDMAFAAAKYIKQRAKEREDAARKADDAEHAARVADFREDLASGLVKGWSV